MAQVAPVAPPAELEVSYEVPEQVTLLSDAWRRIRRNRIALVGGVIIAILFVVALISIVWTPYPVWLQAVGPTYQPPSAAHPLGLDQAGRDILSRIMGGALITIQVGVGSAIILSAIGIPLGLLAGFYRGWVDTAISFVINIWYGIPDPLLGRDGERRLPRHGLRSAHRARPDHRAVGHAHGLQLAGRRPARRIRPTDEAVGP